MKKLKIGFIQSIKEYWKKATATYKSVKPSKIKYKLELIHETIFSANTTAESLELFNEVKRKFQEEIENRRRHSEHQIRIIDVFYLETAV